MEKLFVYGTLGLGQPNEHVLSKIGGDWDEGYVLGHLFEHGWGAAMGYPGIRLSPGGERIHGYLFSSDGLKNAWKDLDEFEGEEYVRVKTTVTLKQSAKELEAFIYVLK
ncbi:MAG: gamma-glutamylcyclotransferase [Bacteroidota bacterium]